MGERRWSEMNFDYTYPDDRDGHELNLKPGSELHDKIVKDVVDKAKAARQHGSAARDEWREMDRLLSAYVTYEDDDDRRARKHDPRKPVNIVVPFSRACLEIFVTFQASTHLAGGDIYRYTGLGGGRSMARALLLEQLVNMQSHWFKHPLRHITCYRDMFAYGVGAMAPVWRKEKRHTPVSTEVTSLLREFLGDELPKAQVGDIIRYFEEVVIHEGSELQNLDPYNLLLDPNVPINDYQRGEFVGYLRKASALEQLSEEHDPEMRMFNGKYLREYLKASNTGLSAAWRDSANREEKYDTGGSEWFANVDDTNYNCHYIHMFRRIIPSDFDMPGDKPELWLFTVAADEVVVQCDRLDLDHGKYPLVIGAPTTTGYDVWPVSGLSATAGMQRMADFFMNMVAKAERKSLNGVTIFDPSVLEPADMMSPEPFKMVRLRRSILGGGDIRQFVHQLQDNNTTQGHIQQVGVMYELMNSLLGTQDVLSGDMSRMPERPTAHGLASAQQNAMGRLQTSAQIITEQIYYDLSMMLAHNTIQYMSEDVAMDITGPQWDERVRSELGLAEGEDTMLVSPYDLEASFDVRPVNRLRAEGSAQAMSMFIERLMSVPEIMMDVFSEYDAGGMFAYAARKLGFESIHEFKRAGGQVQPQVMPDEAVAQGLEQGDLRQI